MLYTLLFIIGILFTILFVIGTHEFAHFITARLLNIKVLRFSIGFGKRLFGWRDKNGTEYVFALIPLGGYVKMLDENEGDVSPAEKHLAYNRQPLYKKFLVVLAGPFANIICAFLLYWLLFVVGITTVKPIIGEITPDSIAAQSGMKANQEIIKVDDYSTASWIGVVFRILMHAGNQDELSITTKSLKQEKTNQYRLNLASWQLNNLTPEPLKSLGIEPYIPNIPLVIGNISEDSPATKTLKVNDRIIAINGEHIYDWLHIATLIKDNPDKKLTFTIERNGKKLSIPVTIGYQRTLFMMKQGFLGIAPKAAIPDNYFHEVRYSVLGAIPQAWQQITQFTYFNFIIFGKLITGKLSVQSLGGPITIFQTAGDAFTYGFRAFISFLAFLSISIGIINLLPIPGLDGGHLFLQIIERIIGRPIPDRVLLLLFRLGIIFIFVILIQALINDIVRLIE